MLTLLAGVCWDDVPVPGERGHELLARLVLAHPQAVPVGELVEGLWPDEEPAHPDKALQVLVSRTRTRTSPEAVVRAGAGYRLGLRPDQVDALRLRDLVGQSREARTAGDLDVTRHAARDALGVALTTPPGESPLGELVQQARRRQDDARRLLGSALLARGETEEALGLLEHSLERRPDDEDLVAEVLRAEAAVRGVPSALARYASYVERTLDASGAEPGERLRQLHAELLARDAPVREGLRYDATPLVGRDDDVARLRALMAEHRVVSVVGPGGLGKTRVAHLLGRLATQPVVFFVELAGVTAGDAVLRKVAADLGVRDTVDARAAQSRGTDLRARLAQRLAAAPTLLVLDNCEHVLDAVAELVAFLSTTTDRVQVLTTSRAPLGISAEQVYPLGQLDVAESVELFCGRARSARPGVHLAPAEVNALVTRLDGLPLAVELAAAKVKAMSVAEISRRLGDRFALLAGGDRSAPDRHRTLEAVIDWSWRLLRPEDQVALARLSVFPDGFSMGGAESLLGHDPLASLVELADQSLLVVGEDGSGTVRYRFLETVREYAAQQRDRAGDRAAAEAALRTWAVGTARDLDRRLFTPDQPRVMGEVRAEEGNLAGVLRAGLEQRDVATVVPLAGLLSGFWSVSGEHLIVMGLTRPVLDVLDAVSQDDLDSGVVDDSELRVVLSTMALNEALFTGGVRASSLDRLRSMGPGPWGRRSAMAVLMLAIYGGTGRPDLDALERLTEDPDPMVVVSALHWLSHAQENVGDMAAARRSLERALVLCDDADGPWLRGQMESTLSGLVAQDADWEACIVHASSALRVMEELGATQDVLQLEVCIGLADVASGRLVEAGERLRRVARRPGSDWTSGWSAGSVGLAELALAEGDVDTALANYREAWRGIKERDTGGIDIDHEITPWMLAESSSLYVHVRHDRADRLADLAEALRGKFPRIMVEEGRGVDYPVSGCVLLALGAYDLVTGSDPDRAVRALVLARRFGYQRTLPSMAWSGVEELAERCASGLLAAHVAAYDDRLPTQLRQEAVEALCGDAQVYQVGSGTSPSSA